MMPSTRLILSGSSVKTLPLQGPRRKPAALAEQCRPANVIPSIRISKHRVSIDWSLRL